MSNVTVYMAGMYLPHTHNSYTNYATKHMQFNIPKPILS